MQNHIAEAREPALDGLRGVAVLLVILVHLQLLKFGWVGVQLFFVLSGFLITRILIGDSVRRTFGDYLGSFYIRRALRLLPALYLYLAIVALAALLTQSWGNIEERLLPAAFFFTNFDLLNHDVPVRSDSWHGFAINHLWSLAVEEHFYLLWPLVVYFAGPKHLLKVVIACIVAGPCLRWIAGEWWLEQNPESAHVTARAVYVLTTSHLDAFASGALISLIPALGTTMLRNLVFTAIILAFVVAMSIAGNVWSGNSLTNSLLTLGFPGYLRFGSQYIWGYTILNLLFAQALLLAVSYPQLAAALSTKFLVFTGRISYGLYLVHLPLTVLVFRSVHILTETWGLPREAAMLIVVPLYLIAIYTIAGLSYHFYELPLLALKRRWASSPINLETKYRVMGVPKFSGRHL